MKFKNIKFKNFLSYGNKWTEYIFEDGITRLSGLNGQGKSVLTDCIWFSLFGKPYRQKITLGQLVNSINKKELEVVLELEVGQDIIRIERGLKPSYFRVYRNNKIIPLTSEKRGYQDILEEEILHFGENIANQILIKSLTRDISFLPLPKADKRKVVEGIFDIEIFSDMNKMAKKKADDLELAIQLANKDMVSIDGLITQEFNNLQNLKDLRTKMMEESNKNTDEIDKKIASAQEEIQKYELAINKIASLKIMKEKSLDDIKKIETDIKTKKESIDLYNGKVSEYNKAQEAIENNKDIIKEIDTIQNDLIGYRERLRVTSLGKDLYNKLDAKIQVMEQESVRLVTEKTGLVNEKNFLEKQSKTFTEMCPECPKGQAFAQKINESNFDPQIEELDRQLGVSSENIRVAKLTLQQYLNALNSIPHLESTIKDKESQIVRLEGKKKIVVDVPIPVDDTANVRIEINVLNEQIYTINITIDKMNQIIYSEPMMKSTITKSQESIVELTKSKQKKIEEMVVIDETRYTSLLVDKKASIDKYNRLHFEKKHWLLVRTLLADEGIKAFIIKQYLPTINKLLNTYLQKFNAGFLFKFDEEFDEVITTRYKEGFNYFSFSEGQKRRIDLAIMFMFSQFSKTKNKKANTNLMILDEITAGCDAIAENALYDILKDIVKSEGKEIITISHSKEIDVNKIDRVFEIDMDKGFSTMERAKN